MTKISHKILIQFLVLTLFFGLTAFSAWVSVQSFRSHSLLTQQITYIQHSGNLGFFEQDPSTRYLNINLINSPKTYKIHKSLYDRRRYLDKFFDNEALASCLKTHCQVFIETHREDLLKLVRSSDQEQIEYIYSLVTENAKILPREKVQEELKAEIGPLFWLKIIMPIASIVMASMFILFLTSSVKEALKKSQ